MDIAACFDSINQPLLIEILKQVVTEVEYLVQKYSVLYPCGGKLRKVFCRKAQPSCNLIYRSKLIILDELGQFAEKVHKLAQGISNSVFVDQVVYTFEDKEDVLDLLVDHISNSLVKV